jgi:hydroxypyruvate reductase
LNPTVSPFACAILISVKNIAKRIPPRRLRRDALAIFESALRAADAGAAVERSLQFESTRKGDFLDIAGRRIPMGRFERIFVVAAGKAAAPMAAAVERILAPRGVTCGVAVVKRGHATSRPASIAVREAGHPIPDQPGVSAAHEIEDLLRIANARDLVIVLISGGASALLAAPAPPLTLRDKQRMTDLLLRAGADIFALNIVRKHLSSLKGGRLAVLAYPATVVTLMLSDVIGDPVSVIGSGPTAPDESTFGDALRVVADYGLTAKAPRAVMDHLERGARGLIPETPKPDDPLFANVQNVVIASNRQALLAAAKAAKRLGYRPILLSSSMRGEARAVAGVHAEIVREILTSGHPAPPPVCLLSGGETTVTVRGHGRGGRNQEFALAAAIQLHGLARWLLLSAGTDGTDGPTDAAGAIASGNTVDRAERAGLAVAESLEANDSYTVFQSIEELVKTGPTGTNVMDVNLFLVV